MGQFESGHMKLGGRQKGVPNKKTLLLSQVFDALNFSIPEQIVELLPQLDKDKRVDVLLQLLPYLYPRRKSVELETLEECMFTYRGYPPFPMDLRPKEMKEKVMELAHEIVEKLEDGAEV